MLDVLLVKLNYESVLSVDREFDLGTAYLAAALRRQGYAVEIIDASLEELSFSQTVARVLNQPAKILGLSVWLHRLVGASERMVAWLRRAGVTSHITVGSHSPTFLYAELLQQNPGLDSVVCGEGEWTLLELAERVCHGKPWNDIAGLAVRENGQVSLKVRPAVCELDELPPPALDYLPRIKERGQFMSMLTSRGCYGRCTFCSTSPFYRAGGGKPWRAHSPERVLSEIAALNAQGIRHFGWRDDNFIGPGRAGRERARRIGELILAGKLAISFYIACRVDDVDRELFALLKAAGLRRVFLGVESLSERRLAAFNKFVTVEDNVKAMQVLGELQIPYTLGYIMLAPDTTWAEYRESSTRLAEVQRTVPGASEALQDAYSAVEILPGTDIAEELRGAKRLQGDHRAYRYRFQDTRVAWLHRAVSALRALTRPLARRVAEAVRKERRREMRGEE
ncbi:MAG: Hopanoid C-3 methylase [Firmicutes bacterium]|nr:Hopanoid C-3 methylase [candidate division NPL-UPA2 bacterium]